MGSFHLNDTDPSRGSMASVNRCLIVCPFWLGTALLVMGGRRRGCVVSTGFLCSIISRAQLMGRELPNTWPPLSSSSKLNKKLKPGKLLAGLAHLHQPSFGLNRSPGTNQHQSSQSPEGQWYYPRTFYSTAGFPQPCHPVLVSG